MRVLIGPGMVPVDQGGQFAGGAAMATYEVAKSLSELGHEVFLTTLHDYRGSSKGTLHILPRKKLAEASKILPKILVKLLSKEKNVTKYYDQISLLEETRFLGVKTYWKKLITKIRPDVISIHGNNLDRFPMIQSAIESYLPLVFTSHGIPEAQEVSYNLSRFNADFFGLLKANNVPIVSVSSGLKERIVNDIGYIRELCSVVVNGISEDFLLRASECRRKRIMSKNKSPDSSIKLITVGSLTKRKNHILVIETMEHLPESYEYYIVGDGPEKQTLQNAVIARGLGSRVHFTGRLTGDALLKAYIQADIFVLTPTSEAFGLVFLEALACGLPIVTMRNLEGIDDLYHPDCFKLVSKYDSEEVASTIEGSRSLIGNDYLPEHAKSYSWEKVAVDYQEVFSMMNNKRVQ